MAKNECAPFARIAAKKNGRSNLISQQINLHRESFSLNSPGKN